MEEVIHYLELKNQYYEKFYSMTVKFLERSELDEWEGLEFFVDNRERILNIIRSYDFKIASKFETLDLTSANLEHYRERVKNLLDLRTNWVKKIITLDLDLIAKVEDVKSDTIRELKKTLQTSQQIGSFLVGPSPRLKTTQDA